jgi:chemotaxis protein CheX
MRVEYINPFILAACKVFRAMLGCELRRWQVLRKRGFQPYHDVSGIIELYGRASGLVVLGLSRSIAIRATEVLLGEPVDVIDARVLDAVGELTNIIAGNAKADLDRLELCLGLPQVLIGRNHTLPFDLVGTPIDIVFGSDLGTVVLEVGLAAHGARQQGAIPGAAL